MSPWRLLGHSDVEPVRHADPGELFPWKKLAEAGVGHYVEGVPADVNFPTLKRGDTVLAV